MRTFPTTRDDLEARAFESGLEIEFSPSTAYLKVGGTLWFAMLPKDAA